MEFPANNEEDLKNQVSEPAPVYATREALENARLREAIDRTYTEKFRFLMTLMQMNRQMQTATIHYK